MFGNTVQLGIKVTSDVAQGVSGLQKTDGIVGKLKVGVLALVTALATAVVGIGAFAVDAIGAAGNLEQSIGAVDTVFKGSAGEMHAWSKDAAQSVGLTRNEFNELGTLIGTQLKNGGAAMDQLAPKTNELIGLGADLSSMFGGTTKEAVEALSSALKGERDPIEKYGVSLNQARIDAKAAELGFTKVGGALSAEASQAATLALIMDQTADAHGNFAKESDTLQGKQQRFAAQMENTKAIIGTALLPIATQLFGFFNDKLGPALGDLANKFSAFVEGLDVAGWWSDVTSGVSVAGDALGRFQPLLSDLANWFNGTMRPALEGFASAAQERFEAVALIVGEFVSGVMAYVEPLAPKFQEIITTVGEIISEGVALFTEVWNLGTQFLLTAWEVVGPPIITVVGTIMQTITGIIGPALDLIKSIISTALAVLRGDWSAAWDGVKSIVSNAWGLIKGIVEGNINAVVGFVQAGVDLVSRYWTTAWDTVKGALSTAWDAISRAVQTGIDGVVGWFRDLPGRITGALSGLGGDLYRMGQNVLQGFIDGVKSMASRVVSAVRGPIDDAIASARRVLGIASPSRLFRQIGVWSGEGLALGLDATRGLVSRAGDQLALAAVPSRMPTIPADRYATAGRGNGGDYYDIKIEGALDPVAVGREVRRVLNAEGRYSGRVNLNGTVTA